MSSPSPSPDFCVPLLDHVVIMLDDAAHRELLESHEINGGDYGRFKIKTATSSLASTYTSVGLAGVSTLMEFFHVEAPPLPALVGALVLSFPRPGSIEAARRRIEEEVGIDPCYELVERTPAEGEEPRPWYHLMRPDLGDDKSVILMLAEVTPAYFEQIGARRGAGGEFHRAAYLEAAIGEPQLDDHLLRDIDEVTIRLEAERAQTLGRLLTALGYAPRETEDGNAYHGPEAVVRIVTSPAGREGIVAVQNVLGRTPEAPLDLSFGETTALRGAGPRAALWTFDPPGPRDSSGE